jgi:PKHD-type hydroxylase|tara:strand:- start:5508 stop:6134 length:627 start_codon:yes stop_codon:yes gene_type:complete
MIQKYFYWYFKSALSSRFCDKLIKHSLSKKDETATTDEFKNKKLTKKRIKDLHKKRNSNVVWVNEPWIYKEIHPYVYEANKNAGWNFEFDRSETCQFTKYKKGQFYNWHFDMFDEPYNLPNNPNMHGKIRKISVICQLTDPSKYKGGELEFDFRRNSPIKESKTEICTEIQPKGSIVVFPSYVWHRVKPVTSGTRYSLVMWNLGRPFK